jgi:autotransporter translocation and assembly factor TamB
VFEELRQAFGLDELLVRFELNRPLEVRVGKYLVRNLFLGFTMTVGEGTQTRQVIKLTYDIVGGVRVGTQVDNEGEFRVTTEYTRRF